MNLTPDQERAVVTDGRDLCVRAGAGSGKTRVLVERAVRLLTRPSDPLPVPRLLAITFTEKAAREMKERLARELSRRGERERRAEAEWAPVSTIHSFCARLLRENAVEAGVDPGFRVLDEFEAATLRREAARRTAEAWAADPARDLSTLRLLPPRDLAGEALDLLDAVRSEGRSPADLPVPGTDGAAVADAVSAVVAGAEALRPLLAGATAAAADRIERVLARLPALVQAAGDAGEAARRIEETGAAVDLKLRDPAAKDALRVLREDVVPAALARVREVRAAPALRALRDFLVDLDAACEAAKAETGALDFADLELRALRLLEGDAEVRESVRGRYRQVMVDEYQDVNPVQERIIRLVSRPGERFVVGDLKQSIYGFRHARPALLRALADEVGPEGRIELRENFRSSPALVAFANRVFSDLFRDADLVEYAGMVPTRPETPGGVETIVSEGDDAAEYREREAAAVAARIRGLVDGGACRFRDVAVLFRSLGAVKVFERALEGRGVPYYVVKGHGFFSAREIVDLSRFLAVVVNPRDEIAFAAALRSPFGGLSDDGLLVLAEARPPAGVLADLLDSPEGVRGLSADDRAAWCAFAERLRLLRRLAGAAPPAEVVEEALRLTGYGTAVYGFPGGRRRAANFRKAVALAESLGGAGGLPRFIEALAEFRVREAKETEAPTGGEEEDVVRLLTIHAAKGLEFPVVFLPDLSRRPPSPSPAVLLGPAGLGAKVRFAAGEKPRPTAAYEAAQAERERREEEEARRLLYVAVTRARDRLILAARAGDPEPRSFRALLGAHFEAVSATGPGGEVPAPPRASLLSRHAAALDAGGPVPGAAAADRAFVDALCVRAATPPPEPDGTHYENTVSELLLYADCPVRHRYRFIYGVPEIRAGGAAEGDGETPSAEGGGHDELPPRETGIVLHEVLRDHDPDSGSAAALARERARAVLRRDDGEVAAAAARMAEAFWGSAIGSEIRSAGPSRAWREVSFLARLRPDREGPGLILRGKIDLLYARADGTLRIVDYKTGGAPASKYRLQVAAYARALREFRPEDLSAALVYLSDDGGVRECPVDVGPGAQAEVDEVISGFGRAMRTGAEPRRGPSADCRTCGYRGFCPAAVPAVSG